MYESQIIEPIDFSGTDPFEIPGNLLNHICKEFSPGVYEDYEDDFNITNDKRAIVPTAIEPDASVVDAINPDAINPDARLADATGGEAGNLSLSEDSISQIAAPDSTFDKYISEKYNCTHLSFPIVGFSSNLYSGSSGSSGSSSSRISKDESNHDMHINDAQLAHGVQNSYEQTGQPRPILTSSPRNVLQRRSHTNPSTKRKQQRKRHELSPRRRRKLLPNKPGNERKHERKNVSLRCHVRKCLSALEDAKSLSRTVQNEAMLNFVSQTMKQTRYEFMQQFGYEIDNYCLPTLRSQCTVYKDTIGETCTVVYRSTSVIKVETQGGAIVEFRQKENEWCNQSSGKVLSY